MFRGFRVIPQTCVPYTLLVCHVAQVVYEEMPGWKEDISGARSWDDLPLNAKLYIKCAGAFRISISLVLRRDGKCTCL